MPKFDERFVHLRVKRITEEDLNRKPNKWISGFPHAARARRVLDIACGMGFDSFAWARAGKRPVGIDFNFDLVKAAAAQARSLGLTVDFVVADATQLPFRENSFQISYSENLFEHVPAWQSIGEEVTRVLAPEGIFFVRTTNKFCPKNNEINNLHFYPWLPEAVKRPIMRWIAANRPAWVNYTTFPAVNWFTHGSLASFFTRRGFAAYEVFDLVERTRLSAQRARLYPLLAALKRFRLLRYLVYPFMTSVQIVAVKKAAAGAAPPLAAGAGSGA